MSVNVPELNGIHHLKVHVTDVRKSARWYARVLGYRPWQEFVEGDRLFGYGLDHPNGGTLLTLRLDPEHAARSAGWVYFEMGVPKQGRPGSSGRASRRVRGTSRPRRPDPDRVATSGSVRSRRPRNAVLLLTARVDGNSATAAATRRRPKRMDRGTGQPRPLAAGGSCWSRIPSPPPSPDSPIAMAGKGYR